MNYRLMFTLNAIVSAVAGVFFVAAPKSALLMFGVVETYSSALMMSRFFGGALILIAVFIWLLGQIQSAQKNTVIALMSGAVGGLALTLLGMFSDKVIRANGWILLLVYLLFAAGYAYLFFGVSVKVKGAKKK